MSEKTDWKAESNKWEAAYGKERSARIDAQGIAEEKINQFNDLKTRLAQSEMENARLRGYIQRVQEDDVVREELVTTGDPEGQRQLVPKRKSTVFTQPDQFMHSRDEGLYSYRDRPQPKHWVTY